MSILRAVVPRAILRRWDAIAADQLLEAAASAEARLDMLRMECDQLRHELRMAEDTAQFWRDSYDIAMDGGRLGLTVDGQAVRI